MSFSVEFATAYAEDDFPQHLCHWALTPWRPQAPTATACDQAVAGSMFPMVLKVAMKSSQGPSCIGFHLFIPVMPTPVT